MNLERFGDKEPGRSEYSSNPDVAIVPWLLGSCEVQYDPGQYTIIYAPALAAVVYLDDDPTVRTVAMLAGTKAKPSAPWTAQIPRTSTYQHPLL